MKYFVELFTEAKSFKNNPLIGSRRLNRCGLHVLRLLISHLICNYRYWRLSSLMPKDKRAEFKKNGFAVFENIIPEPLFERVKEEILSYEGDGIRFFEGTTKTNRIRLSLDQKERFPACSEALHLDEIANPIKYGFARNEPPLTFVQVVQNLFREGVDDVQRTLHADTFHPTAKFWLYINDIDEHRSPLQYSVGSHKLTLGRIKWEYKRSLCAQDYTDGGTEHGSFRNDEAGLKDIGYPPATPVKVPPNSLVVVNTFGFHCRGKAIERTDRIELWGYNRDNPFNPFVNRLSKQKYIERHQELDAQEKPLLVTVGGWEL